MQTYCSERCRRFVSITRKTAHVQHATRATCTRTQKKREKAEYIGLIIHMLYRET